eukprot:CAMPEP_0171132644 /NCGR_PEP_ID=MMETSP0766_2-20121228/124931_1 /TAXON_ID=439317 /ORGANISM="Gambierdiscus australes, Strain CAWD 149" /LENGTH=74 /DNA_ID=CAMNT_0011595995 /DNA_START=314 /DNA_END=534 /DNA_ORIENTATION=+
MQNVTTITPMMVTSNMDSFLSAQHSFRSGAMVIVVLMDVLSVVVSVAVVAAMFASAVLTPASKNKQTAAATSTT